MALATSTPKKGKAELAASAAAIKLQVKYQEMRRNAEQNTIYLMKALESTKALRSSVEGVFTFLSCTAEAPNNISDSGEKNPFLRGLQDKLQVVDVRFKEVAKNMDNVGAPYFADQVNDPLAWMNWDGPLHKDNKIVDNYNVQQFFRRISEHSNCAFELLQKRHHETLPTYVPQKYKSVRSSRVQQVSHNQSLAILGNLQRHASLKIQLQHAYSGHKVVKIGVDKVFIAYLSLWQMQVENVNIKGYGEQVNKPNKDQSDEESLTLLNTPSQIQLFRKITDHANCAKLFYYDQVTSSTQPSQQLSALVLFLRSYHNLFSSNFPCIHCKKHMKDGQPPYYRDFIKIHQISHKSCHDKRVSK